MKQASDIPRDRGKKASERLHERDKTLFVMGQGTKRDYDP